MICRQTNFYQDEPVFIKKKFIKKRDEHNQITKIGINNFNILINALYLHIQVYAVMCTEYQIKVK